VPCPYCAHVDIPSSNILKVILLLALGFPVVIFLLVIYRKARWKLATTWSGNRSRLQITRTETGEWSVPSNPAMAIPGSSGREAPFTALTTKPAPANANIFLLSNTHTARTTSDGRTTITESITLTAEKRRTYPQDWPAYNERDEENDNSKYCCTTLPQCSEPAQAKGARALLCQMPSFPRRSRFIRPSLADDSPRPLRCANQRIIDRVPHFNSIFNYLENPTYSHPL